ncbi:type II secretion system protein H [compost metagenome]
MYRIPANRGFTLIELLITIAIAALLLTLAVPSMLSTIEGSAVNRHVTTFISALRYARSEAIRTGVPVVMCRSANSESATPTCTTASGGWETGWLIFVNRDLDASNNYSSSGNDSLLRVQGVLADSGGILKTSGAAVNKFVFRPTGLLSAGAASFTFNSASLNGAQQKLVCISMQGRARILSDSNASCTGSDS